MIFLRICRFEKDVQKMNHSVRRETLEFFVLEIHLIIFRVCGIVIESFFYIFPLSQINELWQATYPINEICQVSTCADPWIEEYQCEDHGADRSVTCRYAFLSVWTDDHLQVRHLRSILTD